MSLLEIRKSQRAALDKIEAQLLQIRIDARDVGLDGLAERAQAFQYDVAATLARIANRDHSPGAGAGARAVDA